MATAIGRDALPHSIRHRFPLLERQVYLNSCSQGVLSDAVRDAYAGYLRDWASKINLERIRKAPPRKPTKESPRRVKDKSPHVSTARLLDETKKTRQAKANRNQ